MRNIGAGYSTAMRGGIDIAAIIARKRTNAKIRV